MRDPDRIPRILAKLAIAWNVCPDARLGQFCHNILSSYLDKETELTYSIGDGVFEEALDSWVAKRIVYIETDKVKSYEMLVSHGRHEFRIPETSSLHQEIAKANRPDSAASRLGSTI